jgi:hypothetical protein
VRDESREEKCFFCAVSVRSDMTAGGKHLVASAEVAYVNEAYNFHGARS